MSRTSYPTVKLFCALLCSAAGLALVPARAQAHIRMDMPPARNMQDGYKPTRSPGFVLPCGIARAAAQPVTSLVAGSTLGLKFTETVYHPGCFIIDFAKADTGPNTMFTRLQIEPHAAGAADNKVYQVSVTLPAEPCTNCILRLRQYMRAAATCPPANLADNNADLYYSCANVILTGGSSGADGGTDAPATVDASADKAPAGSGGASGSGGAGSGGASGTGGTVGTGGAGSGGASGSGGTSAGSGGTVTPADPGGCALGGSPLGAVPLSVGLTVAALVIARRRRSIRRRG